MDSTGNTIVRSTRDAAPPLADREAADRRQGERRRKERFVLRERRSGYDRRSQAQGRTLIPVRVHDWARERGWLIPAVLVAANLLSLLDIALTLRVLEAGAIEVNPLLNVLLEVDIHLAAGVKAVLVAVASLLIWQYRWHRKILPLALVVLAVFAAVVAYQGMLLLGA